MGEDCPLSLTSRYYIAIMAISTYGSEYLFSRLSELYLEVGGDIEWLK